MNVVACLLLARPGQAQIVPTEPGAAVSPDHQHASPAPAWTVNVDGGLFATFNHQGGPRGDRDFRSQNWLMGMVARPIGPGRLIASAMLSLEPLTVGAGGYGELLQLGEAYNGLMNTDRQHPHELFSQLAIGWSQRLAQTTVTVLGAPIGEASLGPPAFMHRASAAENPAAPLAHHILDSTHIASNVIAVRIDQGRFSVDGSSFRGREPDDRHYDVEFGRPDSWASRRAAIRAGLGSPGSGQGARGLPWDAEATPFWHGWRNPLPMPRNRRMLQGSRFPEFWLFPHDRLRGTALIKAGSESRASWSPVLRGSAPSPRLSPSVRRTRQRWNSYDTP